MIIPSKTISPFSRRKGFGRDKGDYRGLQSQEDHFFCGRTPPRWSPLSRNSPKSVKKALKIFFFFYNKLNTYFYQNEFNFMHFYADFKYRNRYKITFIKESFLWWKRRKMGLPKGDLSLVFWIFSYYIKHLWKFYFTKWFSLIFWLIWYIIWCHNIRIKVRREKGDYQNEKITFKTEQQIINY